jgi:hypothetical protein
LRVLDEWASRWPSAPAAAEVRRDGR